MVNLQGLKNSFENFKNSNGILWMKKNINFVFIVAIPLLFSPLPAVIRDKAAYCAYVLIIMSLYWITECLPIAITSLLPVLLFPLFNILSSKCTSQIYFQDIQMLFFGGLVIAIGIENSGLHERVALLIIMGFGSDPKWLLFGVMSVSGFLSLWISNTAAASLMLPIVIALVKQLAKYNKAFSENVIPLNNKISDVSMIKVNGSHKVDDKNTNEIDHIENETALTVETENNQQETEEKTELPNTKAAVNLMKGFCLGIAYAASMGGAGSLVGTTPNLLLKGFFDDNYPNGGLNFGTYMAFCLPVSIIMIFIGWIIIAFIWLPKKELFKCKIKKSKELDPLQRTIRERYRKLGKMTFEQASVGVLFILLVVLWLTRELFVIDGWQYFFGSNEYVSDTTPAILIVILCFMWPRNNIFKGHKYQHLINWQDMKEFPWDVILLGGGSLAIADGFQKSGLSEWVGDIMGGVLPKQKEWALLIIIVFCEFGTEFTSNTSMASIFIPIADSLARRNEVMPHYFLLPLTICVSLAFMFPVATPPNAIVFGSGYIKIKDMVISGILIKIIGIFVLLLAASTWLDPIFSLSSKNPSNFNNTLLNFLRADASSGNITKCGGC